MSRKHFVALASEIHKIQDDASRRAAAIAVVAACRQFNGAFDAGRFYTACGVEI
jgi:hypothetical protein